MEGLQEGQGQRRKHRAQLTVGLRVQLGQLDAGLQENMHRLAVQTLGYAYNRGDLLLAKVYVTAVSIITDLETKSTD